MSFETMHKRRMAEIKSNLVEAAGVWIAEARKLVAIDTGVLLNSLKTGGITSKNGRMSIELGSYGVRYAKWVELGNSKYNVYHRNKKVVYSGDGQFFLDRAKENKLENIISILKK